MRKFLTAIMIITAMAPLAADADVLSLRDAIAQGLKASFDIQTEKVNKSVRQDNMTAEQAKFDPVAAASVSAGGSNTPIAYATYNFDYLKERSLVGEASLTKLHENGMTGQFSFKTLKTDTNDPYQELEPQYETIFEMNITQPLLKNYGKDINLSDVKKAELSVREAQLDLYWKMLGKTYEIETAYYGLARAQDILDLAKQSESLADKLLSDNRKRFKAGMIAVTEVQEAETAKAARDEQVVSAERDVDTALNNLENLINPDADMTGTTAEPLKNVFASYSSDEAYKQALTLRPDLEKQKTELEKMNITLKYLKNQELPELDLKNTLGVIGLSGNETTSNHFNGNYPDAYSDMADAKGFEWYVGLQFSMPLGERAAKARTSAAEGEKTRQVLTLKNMERTAKTDVKNAVVAIDSGKKRYDVAETFVSLAQTTLDQEMKKLKEGMSDTFHVLKYQDDLISARMRAVNALYDYNTGVAMLNRATATSLDRYGFKIGE